jgi:hypothetical protein
MAETLTEEVVRDLKEIKRELKYIREHMLDADTIVTPEGKICH